MKIIIWILVIIVALVIIGWIGLRVRPAPFDPISLPATAAQTTPLPDGLPAPVDRFYRQVYGDEVPVVKSAVLSGRATMRIQGITFPARFRFTHRAGDDYRHYIEATLFGLPLMRVNERYLEGVGRMELPVGTVEDEPKVNQGANLALWAEGLWFPTLFVTDDRARWEAVDENTALLFVPYGDEEEHFVVRFDPQTGRPRLVEAMRYKAEDSEEKTLWLNEALQWGTVDGHPTATEAAVTWLDDGRPWAVFTVEDIVLNANVDEYIRERGP
ncbi:MAG TPA: DUF6544 family protein [Candidatus Sulfomarinibacteraceae bacterium]|nr:DUF6544 family protein [Candidatus Sulfomarinibacteraceae bacterium]